MTTTDLADWTATELTAAYRAGTVSPVEAAQAVLERISRCDPAFNAFCLVDADAAMADARASEQRWATGRPAGPVDGVPTSIKDVFLTRGWPTLRGSRTIDPAQPWTEDAPCVARLRDSGAVLLGKTTTPEIGWKGVTDSPLTGVTRNPWDPARTPGGSSGGAAAAVATGMGALAVGTDGGGSVRIPASFTGTVALKPTYGRIPLYPASPFGTLAHAGPMTRSVEDAALLLDVLSEPDSRDPYALPEPSDATPAGVTSGVDGLRIAFSLDLGYVRVDPEVARAVTAAVGCSPSSAVGSRRVDPGFSDPVEAFHVLWYAGAAHTVEHLDDERRGLLDPALLDICEQGRNLTALDYLRASAHRTRLGTLMGRFHERFDLLVTPTMPITAFAAGVEVPAGSTAVRWTSWTPFSYPFNLTQQPAASVPCGLTDDGLPVGLQLVGPRHRDARVLAAAKAYQDAVAPLPAPPLPGGAG